MACRDSYFGGYDEDRFEKKVDQNLLCSICFKVLKDPVQCPNEHYGCRSCLQKHLEENSENCPTCQHPLTKETLTKPPRILLEFLLSLKIRCDHVARGCPELIKLEWLDRHVEMCAYSPTRCGNDGCSEVINRSEKQRHESQLCPFRKIVCDECGEKVLQKSIRLHTCYMRKDVDNLTKDMREVKGDVKQIKQTQEELVKEFRNMMVRIPNRDEMNIKIKEATKEATERCDLFTGRQKILVCGGYDGDSRLNSAESYSWLENSWTPEPAMKEKRSAASAFVHEREIFVTGGATETEEYTDSIESLNVDEEHANWIQPAKMPIKCYGHTMICHDNNMILTGGQDGDNVSDEIYQTTLNPPYATKLLTQMPEPRWCHGCEIIDNQIVIIGGMKSKFFKDVKNTVYSYDINNNECKPMAPLPFAITNMATVSYKGYVILIGGVNEKGKTLDSVIMYDLKTGKITMLPGLNHKRAASAAVITGSVILVIGGHDYETNTWLDSVECLDLSSNSTWRELSPMTTKRNYAMAVLKPII